MDNNGSNNTEKRLDSLEEKIEILSQSVERLYKLLGGENAINKPVVEHLSKSASEERPEIKVDVKATVQPLLPVPPPPDISSSQAEQPVQGKPAPPKPIPQKPKQSFKLPEHMKKGDYWLNRVGIALLLFGVVFLFKYSIDNGWLKPWIRIAFGLALGLVVQFLGYRIYGKRRNFATSLLGAGLSVWYITGFSAYQLLELVSHPTAFGFMIIVTLTAFVMSIKQDDAILSLIAAIGGFGTPFMLYSSSGNLPGLVIYTSIIIACCLGIYFFKGWRSVLWVSTISGWIIFNIGFIYSLPESNIAAFTTRWICQAGVLFAWLSFWLIPISRELIYLKKPDKWKKTFLGFADNKIKQGTKDILDRHLHLLTVSSPLLGLSYSAFIWPNLSSDSWGWISLGISAVYFLTSYLIRKIPEFKTLKYTHILIAVSIFNLAIVLLLDGNMLLFSLAVEAMILHLLSARLSDKVISRLAHILHFVIFFWMVIRLGMAGEWHNSTDFIGKPFTDLWVILTFIASCLKQRTQDFKRLYAMASIFLFTALVLNELSGNIELFIISSEAIFVFGISRISKDSIYKLASHVIFGLLVFLMLPNLNSIQNNPQNGLNILTLTNIWSIFLAYIVYAVSESLIVKRCYLLAIILGFALIIVREFTFNIEYVLLTFEAGLVLYFTKSVKDKLIQSYSHMFFAILGFMLVNRFAMYSVGSSETVVFNWIAITNLWFILMIAFIPKFIINKENQLIYRIAAHISFLSLLAIELSRLDNGQGWVSISWGVYGISILLIGLRKNIPRFRIVGLGTLMLLVGKLFLVDLAKLETIWRVLLFIGFGGIFLLLSYYFRSLWNTNTDKTKVENISEE